MAKGIATLFTIILLIASMIVIYEYNNTSMASTDQGVNTTGSEYNASYRQSVHVTITAISVSHYTILLLAVCSVLLSLLVMVAMIVQSRKVKNI